jgi:hypothetical protein
MATVIPGRWPPPSPSAPLPAASRLDRLAGLEPERMAATLAFLSSYAPAVFDAVLEATEPAPAPDPDDALEPYCTRCGARAGIFAGRGDDWQHYAGTPQARTVRPFDADHAPAIGWRPPRDGPAIVAR